MEKPDFYFQALLLQYSEPFFKAFIDYLSKHNLVIVSTKAPNDEALLSTPEAVILLGKINRKKVYELVRNKKLAAVEELGKGYKFRKEDIDNFIKQNLTIKK